MLGLWLVWCYCQGRPKCMVRVRNGVRVTKGCKYN